LVIEAIRYHAQGPLLPSPEHNRPNQINEQLEYAIQLLEYHANINEAARLYAKVCRSFMRLLKPRLESPMIQGGYITPYDNFPDGQSIYPGGMEGAFDNSMQPGTYNPAVPVQFGEPLDPSLPSGVGTHPYHLQTQGLYDYAGPVDPNLLSTPSSSLAAVSLGTDMEDGTDGVGVDDDLTHQLYNSFNSSPQDHQRPGL
jgi:hypothetical protein